jgi:hypothetical protein
MNPLCLLRPPARLALAGLPLAFVGHVQAIPVTLTDATPTYSYDHYSSEAFYLLVYFWHNKFSLN